MKQVWIAMLMIWALTDIVSGQSTTKSVRKIELHSGWGGLGTPQNSTVIIRRENGRYVRNGMPIDAALVDAFISALDAPTVAKPQKENLGVTSIWLRNNLHLAEKAISGSLLMRRPHRDPFSSPPS